MTSSSPYTLYIKHMVCPRRIRAETAVLNELGLHPLSVQLGFAILPQEPDQTLRPRIAQALQKEGFELLDNPRMQLVEALKDAIIDLVHYQEEMPRVNLSDYLAHRFHRDYSALSKLFSEEMGTTLEKYAIAQKIERAKELLTYGELTLGEIADRLGYASTAYLSAQFKSVTGLTPSAFRKSAEKERKSLDAF